jgi:hypothetical protein
MLVRHVAGTGSWFENERLVLRLFASPKPANGSNDLPGDKRGNNDETCGEKYQLPSRHESSLIALTPGEIRIQFAHWDRN